MIFTIFFLVSFSLLYTQIKSNKFIGKHSAIIEADGFTFLSEDKTIREFREEAKAEAKREALEKGQTYIKSVTKVENYFNTNGKS